MTPFYGAEDLRYLATDAGCETAICADTNFGHLDRVRAETPIRRTVVTRMADMPKLTAKLKDAPKTELLTFEGGVDIGNPCEARGHHGFSGIEAEVVEKISAWIKNNS